MKRNEIIEICKRNGYGLTTKRDITMELWARPGHVCGSTGTTFIQRTYSCGTNEDNFSNLALDANVPAIPYTDIMEAASCPPPPPDVDEVICWH